MGRIGATGENTICAYRKTGIFFHFFLKISKKVVDECRFMLKNRYRWDEVGNSRIKWDGIANRQI